MKGELMRIVGDYLAIVWIFGLAFVYFVRFTSIFYAANQDAIDAVVERAGSRF